ncbi:alpha/beta fold hydrolase [Rhodobacteraceae bacterium NNCM2]|nr:alpha/beta fold hydrolase [Coraliihabitans acroporae]
MILSLAHLVHEPEGTETAPPLLIAHGLYGSARNFNSLGRKLADNRRVVMVDMRNHGESPWDDEMTYPAMGDDLAGAVTDLCGGRAVVLGHSMGGKAAMALALTRPELLAGLVVADIAPVTYDHGHEGYIAAMKSVDLAAITRRSDADPVLAQTIPEKMLRSFLLQNLLVEHGKARWRLNLDALSAHLPALMDWPTDWPEPVFEGPTLFLNGGASDYVLPEMHPRIRATFPDVEFGTLAGADHWLHAEQPENFVRAVAAFLDTLG